jgi:amidase
MARTVADAAALPEVLAGPDLADPATAPSAGQPASYTAFLDPGALDGARIGVWREPSAGAGERITAVLDAAAGVLRHCGAQLTDPVLLDGAGQLEEPEFRALLHEFKDDLNGYLAGLGGEHPGSLAELIDFNIRNAPQVLARFGHDLFERAEATSGRGDPGYAQARSAVTAMARNAIDGALREHRLDAVITLTGSPAWLTDYVLGDHYLVSSSGPAAAAGYPSVCVPAGQVSGLPVGVSFISPAWSEPVLIGLGHAFELASGAAAGGPGRPVSAAAARSASSGGDSLPPCGHGLLPPSRYCPGAARIR